jgi:hypothetical protein
MKKGPLTKHTLLTDSRVRALVLLSIVCFLLFLSNHAFAKDLLAGTDTDIKDTMIGTGKKWLLWIDGGISLASFAYTKKPVVFFSVLGISLFITALVTMAGATT